MDSRRRSVFTALFVTFLWSTSWILIKVGLRDDIPALMFAGLRYTLAFLCLLPLVVQQPKHIASLRSLSQRDWLGLFALGLLFYSATQGAQFIGLAHLPSITVNLLLSLTTLIVTGLGIYVLREKPTTVQWAGVALYLVGVFTFFYPINFPQEQTTALLVVVGGVVANALGSLLGRSINRRGHLTPLAVTVVGMGVGGPVLLVAGLVMSGLPTLSLTSWLIIAWLAVVNTALAFTLWNNTMRTLSAMESSIINNMMMVQIPLLAWLFLGEDISTKSGVAFALAAVGILIVQLRKLPYRERLSNVWRSRVGVHEGPLGPR